MAISKWIGGILILIAFVIAGKLQASTLEYSVYLEQEESSLKSKKSYASF